MSDKHLEMFLLMNRWLQNEHKGKKIADYLREKGIPLLEKTTHFWHYHRKMGIAQFGLNSTHILHVTKICLNHH